MKDLLISQMPILASLPADELERLAAVAAVRTFPTDTILFKEGEQGNVLYSIVSGQAQIIKAIGTEDERIIGVSGPGEFVGEMSLLTPERRRTASVRSLGELQVLEVPLTEFESLLQRYPSVDFQLINLLGRRLNATNNATIHDLHNKNRELSDAHGQLTIAYRRLSRTRHFAIAMLVLLLLIASTIALALGYYLFGVRTALDTPTEFVLTMAELGRTIIVPAEAAALPNPQPLTPDTIVNARRSYTGRCSTCHGPDGKGDTAIGSHIFPRAPDLTADQTQNRRDGALFWIVQNGSPHTGMPGWKGTLSDDEIWQLVSYVRLLPKGLDVIVTLLPTPVPTPTSLPTATPAPQATPTPIRATTTLTVTITEYQYVPVPLIVPIGARVIWVNKDDDDHNIISDARPPLLDSPVLALGGTYTMVFVKPGTYAYSCTLHDFMHGTVVVQ